MGDDNATIVVIVVVMRKVALKLTNLTVILAIINDNDKIILIIKNNIN